MLTQEGELAQQASYRQLVWNFLRWKPGSDGMTASGLCQWMQRCGWQVRLSSLSSQLARMVKSGELAVLQDRKGPRGGKVYVLGEEG